jgi:hypothetical protein
MSPSRTAAKKQRKEAKAALATPGVSQPKDSGASVKKSEPKSVSGTKIQQKLDFAQLASDNIGTVKDSTTFVHPEPKATLKATPVTQKTPKDQDDATEEVEFVTVVKKGRKKNYSPANSMASSDHSTEADSVLPSTTSKTAPKPNTYIDHTTKDIIKENKKNKKQNKKATKQAMKINTDRKGPPLFTGKDPTLVDFDTDTLLFI